MSRLAPCSARWNTSPSPLRCPAAEVGPAPAPRGSSGEGAVAIAPKITLEIRYADRSPIKRSFGPGRMVIGRESGDIILGDPETSALHAELEFTQGRVIVRDLGSRNGTLKDGKAMPQFALFAGQAFKCGATELVLLEVQGTGQTPSPGGTAAGSEKIDEALGQSSATLEGGSVHESASTLPESASPTLPGKSEVGPRTLHAPGAPPPPGAIFRQSSPTLSDGEPDVEGPVNAPTMNPSTVIPTDAPDDAPPAAQPSAPTPSDRTAVAPVPAVPTPSADAPSGPAFVGDVPVGAPPTADQSQPVVLSGATQTAAPVQQPVPPQVPPQVGPQAQAAPQVAPQGQAPPPATPAGASPRGPVANAVIKPGELDLGPKKRKARTKGAGAKVAKWLAAGVVGLGALAGIAFLVYTLVVGRGQAYFGKMAAELPQDAIGVVAIKSPKTMLELFGDEVPEGLSDAYKEDLGFDPLDVSSYEEMGLDVDAPAALGLLSPEGTISVSLGVKDRDKLQESLSTRIKEAAGLEEDLRWIERAYEGMPGMWLDEPMPVAVLWPEDRAIFVAGGDSDAVARLAKEVAKAADGDNLSTRPGFEGIVKQRGKMLAAAYIDGGSGRAALQRPGIIEAALLSGLADVDGLAFAVIDDGPRIDFVWQTVLRDGAEMLALLEGPERDSKALASIPTPVLTSVDVRIDASAIYRSISATPMGLGLKAFESEFKEETGLDLRADILENITGEYGFALLNLPPEDSPADFGAVAWLGLVDEDAAKKSTERYFAKAQSRLELEQVAGATVYVDDSLFRTAFFIHAGQLWLTIGKVDIEPFVDGPSKSLANDHRVPQIGKALEKGGLAAGFFDVRQFLFAARPLMNESEREEEKKLAPVLGPMEVVTLRSETKKRTIVTHVTVHTTWDHAMPSLVQSAIEVLGVQLAEKLERQRRLDKCSELIDHLMGLMRDELGADAVAEIEYETRSQMLDECLSDETSDAEIECMKAATSLDTLGECEKVGDGEDGGTPADVEEPDPKAVPFVDDIWPSTKPTGAGNGRPDPAVNYAAGLGEDPQVRGPDNALVTIVMFADFQCPYCKRSLGTLDEVMAKYGRDVRIVFRHNPLPMHGEARAAAKAAIAAAKQGKFWKMHDKLFDNQHSLTESNFVAWASEMGLDTSKFELDLADRFVDTQIDADIEAAKYFGAKVTPSFFINGRYLAGAQPMHSFEELIDEELERAKKFVERRGDTRKGLYEDMRGRFADKVTKPPPTPIATPKTGKRYTVETGNLPRRGTSGIARVEIVECGDFDCPFCKRAASTMDEIVKDYSGSVAMFWLHNPLSFHPGAEPAARAAVAAANQDKFWEMHDKLFEDKSLRSRSDFETMARDLGLDVTQFLTDFDAEETKDLVAEQQKTCTDNDAKGTPSFFINGRYVSGAQSYDRFKEVIDEELAGGI